VYVIVKQLDPYNTMDVLGGMALETKMVIRDDSDLVSVDGDKYIASCGSVDGRPLVVRVCGDEFVQSLQALSLPSKPQDEPPFKIGDWVCVTRLGNYRGDIGCIHGIEGAYIMLLLPPRICDGEEEFEEYRTWCIQKADNVHWSWPLAVETHPHFGLDCLEHEEGWLTAKDRLTLLLKPFKAWELSHHLPDRCELSILPFLANIFRKFLNPPMCEHIPPARTWFRPFLEPAGELVLLGSNVGVVIRLGLVAHTGQLLEVYLMGKRVFQIPEQCLIKFHRPGAQVYSIQDRELGRVVSCDYLSRQIEVERRDGTKVGGYLHIFSLLNVFCLKVKRDPNELKSARSSITNGVLVPLIETHLKHIDITQTQARTWIEQRIQVFTTEGKLKGQKLEVTDVERVSDDEAQRMPLSSGIILSVLDQTATVYKTHKVAYDTVKEWE
jgi:hypothetical protein